MTVNELLYGEITQFDPSTYVLPQTKLRQAVIDALGGKCRRCGFTDVRALQIDHVNGDGFKDRRKNRFVMYRRILTEGHTDRYQLLCANCNWIKRHENSENGSWLHLSRTVSNDGMNT